MKCSLACNNACLSSLSNSFLFVSLEETKRSPPVPAPVILAPNSRFPSLSLAQLICCAREYGSFVVIFPKSIFEPASASTDEQAETSTEKDAQETVETDKDSSTDKPKPTEENPEAKEVTEKEKTETKQEPEVVAKQKIEGETEEKAQDQSGAEEKTGDEDTVKEEAQAADEEKGDDIDACADDNTAEEKTATTNENKGQSVSETIQKMTESSANIPGEHAFVSSTICAKDIMEKDVVWGSSEDSVQQALTKMQQANVGYMLVGSDEQFEGIVSKSDIAGAVSIYLRPVFAKWHRPLDDATLQIKIKWITSKLVRTVKLQTPLTTIMENMRRYGDRALPVINEQGKIQGLITIFDIFKVLLNDNSDISIAGKTPQMPPLV